MPVRGTFDDTIRDVMAQQSVAPQPVVSDQDWQDLENALRQMRAQSGPISPADKFRAMEKYLKTHPGNQTRHMIDPAPSTGGI